MSCDDPLMRFGITMERSLLQRLDRVIEEKGYSSRSDFLRRLARAAVVEAEFESQEKEMVGTLTLLYQHEHVNLGHALTSAEHGHLGTVTATIHVHLDEGNCLEVLVLQGSSRHIREIADEIASMRGVKLAELSLAALSKDDEPGNG
ncbi:MAG: nickel-responsive transcriptional regulator NikR [Bacillota bacterium]